MALKILRGSWVKASGEHNSIVPYSISLSPDSSGSMIDRSSRLKYRAFMVKSLALASVNKSDFILAMDNSSPFVSMILTPYFLNLFLRILSYSAYENKLSFSNSSYSLIIEAREAELMSFLSVSNTKFIFEFGFLRSLSLTQLPAAIIDT